MTNSLAAKIAQASTKVGALKTDKTNTQQKYDYISADKILERAGDALASVGVIVMPSIVDEVTAAVSYVDGYGKEKTRYDSTVRFNMVVMDDEMQMELPWFGRGNDYAVPDKALYKAITSGHKYFLMKLLNVGVGNEDGEHESVEAAQGAPQPQQAQQQGNRTSASATTQQRAPMQAVKDNPFDAATDDEIAIMSKWGNRTEAEMWAVSIGACANEFEAKNSLNKVVGQHGGKVTKENIAAIYLDYCRKQLGKLEQKVAA